LYFFHLEFTHVPPSRYLFSGAVVDSSAQDTPDTSSSFDDVPSSSNHPDCGGSSICQNSGQLDPDTKGCDGAVLEHIAPQHQKTDTNSDNVPPKTHKASLADTKDGESSVTKHDGNKNVHEPPQLGEPPSKRPNLEIV